MKSLYGPRESNECIVKSFSPCRQTSLSSTSTTPSLCSPDNQPAAQVQVRSNKGVSLPLLHIPIAPRQIATKPNQISGDIDTASTSTLLLTEKSFYVHIFTAFLIDFEVLAVVKRFMLFWAVMARRFVDRYERFGET